MLFAVVHLSLFLSLNLCNDYRLNYLDQLTMLRNFQIVKTQNSKFIYTKDAEYHWPKKEKKKKKKQRKDAVNHPQYNLNQEKWKPRLMSSSQ